MKPKKLTCSQFFVFEDLAFFPTVLRIKWPIDVALRPASFSNSATEKLF